LDVTNTWYPGNKWPPTDDPTVKFRRALTKTSTKEFPQGAWTSFYYSIPIIGELVLQKITTASWPGYTPPGGFQLCEYQRNQDGSFRKKADGSLETLAATELTWDKIKLTDVLEHADVDAELSQLCDLIEYRPAVITEAQQQVDAPGVIGYFRGI